MKIILNMRYITVYYDEFFAKAIIQVLNRINLHEVLEIACL